MKSKKAQLLMMIVVLIVVVVMIALIYKLVLGFGKTAVNATGEIPSEFIPTVEGPPGAAPAVMPTVDLEKIPKSSMPLFISDVSGVDPRDEKPFLSPYTVVGWNQNLYGHYIRVTFSQPLKGIPYRAFTVYESDDTSKPDDPTDWDTVIFYDGKSHMKVRRLSPTRYEIGPFDPENKRNWYNVWFNNQRYIWISDDEKTRYLLHGANGIAFDSEK